MAHIKVEDLWLSYPVIVNAGSVRKAIMNTLLGGFTRPSEEQKDIVMVDAIRGISFELKDSRTSITNKSENSKYLNFNQKNLFNNLNNSPSFYLPLILSPTYFFHPQPLSSSPST